VVVNRDVARLKRSELSNASGKTKIAGFGREFSIPGSLATFCYCATGGTYHSTMICDEEKESWNTFVRKEWWMVEWCKITVTFQYIRIELRHAVEWTQLSYAHQQTQI